MTQGDEGGHKAGLSDALIDYDRVADVYDLYVTYGAGFVPVALYGDYDRSEYLEGGSPFMIWVLEKARRP